MNFLAMNVFLRYNHGQKTGLFSSNFDTYNFITFLNMTFLTPVSFSSERALY